MMKTSLLSNIRLITSYFVLYHTNRGQSSVKRYGITRYQRRRTNNEKESNCHPAFLVFALSTVSAAGSSSTGPVKQTELIVFAAASMTETLQEISSLYAKVAPNVKLIFNFDSSGTLKTQIQQGADCDLFISAGQRQVDQLDIMAPASVNTEKLDFVLTSSRLNLLENRVTLVVPKGNPKNIRNFNNMADAITRGQILLAMGNSDVPVGQYTQDILKYFKLDEKALAAAGRISYGSNVKEVTTQVSEASVDCGIIYCTDAFSAGLDVVDYATTDMCGRVIYPAAVLKTGKNQGAAQAFLNYLSTRDAMAVFEKVGFSKP
jgi:molybdate transport system substrate-binding protein